MKNSYTLQQRALKLGGGTDTPIQRGGGSTDTTGGGSGGSGSGDGDDG